MSPPRFSFVGRMWKIIPTCFAASLPRGMRWEIIPTRIVSFSSSPGGGWPKRSIAPRGSSKKSPVSVPRFFGRLTERAGLGWIPTLLERGMHLILWSAAGYDWKKDVQGITKATLRRTEARSGHLAARRAGDARRRRNRPFPYRPGPACHYRRRPSPGVLFAPLRDFLPSI